MLHRIFIIHSHCLKSQVNNRLYAKRSSIGSRAVQVIEDFFRGDAFGKNSACIAQYAQWAVTKHGPALWRIPTPQNCRVDSTSDEYIVRCHV
jgi:hypothetical protein